MNFGRAMEAVKNGKRAKRSDWGKKEFVYLNHGSTAEKEYGYTRIAFALKRKLFDLGDKNTTTRLPNVNMAAKDGSTITGWTPSQTDMLAEDWEIEE